LSVVSYQLSVKQNRSRDWLYGPARASTTTNRSAPEGSHCIRRWLSAAPPPDTRQRHQFFPARPASYPNPCLCFGSRPQPVFGVNGCCRCRWWSYAQPPANGLRPLRGRFPEPPSAIVTLTGLPDPPSHPAVRATSGQSAQRAGRTGLTFGASLRLVRQMGRFGRVPRLRQSGPHRRGQQATR